MIEYTKGYKYQLHADTAFTLSVDFAGISFLSGFFSMHDRTLLIRAGYAWDGASGPTIDTKTAMRGPLAHDALYQAMREGLLPRAMKPHCDQYMHDVMIEDGMNKIRAWAWLRGVKRFGAGSTIHSKDILRAP